MDVEDSNALILPAKKKNKEKVKTLNKGCENKNLSKSQKRKLKKLAEEKEKDLLLSKSLETLEKYKISEDAYSLLWSSQNIGQAVTVREKRRRDMQYSKAGLEVPDIERHAKIRKTLSHEMEVDAHQGSSIDVLAKPSIVQPVPIERVTLSDLVPSQRPHLQSGCADHGESDLNNMTSKDVGGEICRGICDDEGPSSCHSPADDKKNIATMDDVDGDSKVAMCGEICVESGSMQNLPVAPTVVHVSRPKEVDDSRKGLPIIMMEQEIMDAINSHISIIICGETGCGKTTQVPQFLYEAGYGSKRCSMRSGVIGVTQPRRVAVLSTAKRVAHELGLRLGKEVGFQVRHDRKVGDNCSIKFMTDGILLRELQNDFLLKHYSVLILDEAHERSLNTDILIGMLSRVITQRQKTYEDQKQRILAGEVVKNESRIFPLKLILMSATLRIEDFTSGKQIFHTPPPVVEVPTRQYPVVKHFAKKTELVDYIGEAYKKVLKIHKRLPPGGVLVFVTGQREVEYLCRKLRSASKQFQTRASETNIDHETTVSLDQIDGCNIKEITEAIDSHATSIEQKTNRFSWYDEYHDESDNYDSDSSYNSESELDSENNSDDLAKRVTSEADDSVVDSSEGDLNLGSLKTAFEALAGKGSLNSECAEKERNPGTLNVCSNMSTDSPTKENKTEKGLVGPMHVLPLYAMLPAAAQLRVFEEVRAGERLIVVATNVAETSLTIPGIKYVIDTGREKVKKYNISNGMESYEVQWISKASAAQRAGRAGRTGPGHCYCLYSSAAFANEFPEFSCAEILKIPVDGVVLLMKSMGISKVANFPFPTPPDATALLQAERCLKALEALDSEGRLTPLGMMMAQYPLSPRHSRLLLLAIQIMKKKISHVRPNLVLGYAVAISAALSLPNPFLFQFDSSQINAGRTEQNEQSGSLDRQHNQDQQHKSMRKQMKESAKVCRGKFFHPRSDAITVAYALQCFEQAQNPRQFCIEYSLHLKTMEEMSKLRKQLLRLVFNQRYSGLQQEFSWTHGGIEVVENSWGISSDKNPLFQIEEDILCQAICAGWADRVAKRIRVTRASVEEDRKVNAIPFQAAMVEEPVYLHRWSSIAKSTPQFLVYSEMRCTKRPYIHGATGVESEWLVKYGSSLCTFSAPLTDPKPFYDHNSDQVFCYVIPYFGPCSWELPFHKVPIKDAQQRVAVFAYALLEGQVLPCIKPVKNFMATSPSSILKPEALCQKRVGNLLSKLKTRSRTIDSCAMLRKAWKENPQQLHAEILDWFQGQFHCKFEELWKNMQHEVLLSPEDRFYEKTKKKKRSSV